MYQHVHNNVVTNTITGPMECSCTNVLPYIVYSIMAASHYGIHSYVIIEI